MQFTSFFPASLDAGRIYSLKSHCISFYHEKYFLDFVKIHNLIAAELTKKYHCQKKLANFHKFLDDLMRGKN